MGDVPWKGRKEEVTKIQLNADIKRQVKASYLILNDIILKNLLYILHFPIISPYLG